MYSPALDQAFCIDFQAIYKFIGGGFLFTIDTETIQSFQTIQKVQGLKEQRNCLNKAKGLLNPAFYLPTAASLRYHFCEIHKQGIKA